jgi:hypothetical protein
VDDCNDMPYDSLVPFLELDADVADRQEIFDVGVTVTNGWFKWTINSDTFISDWGEPSKLSKPPSWGHRRAMKLTNGPLT